MRHTHKAMPKLNNKEVGPHGLGLMGFTWRPRPAAYDQVFAAMRAALANKTTYWNGREFYGTPEVNSMTLPRAYLEKCPDDADTFIFYIKGSALLNLLWHLELALI
ncbi:Pyridoxal reductase [Ilyonectria robusta]